MFAGKKSAQIREILISESAWEEMTCLFAPSLEDENSVEILDVEDQETMNNAYVYLCKILYSRENHSCSFGLFIFLSIED